MTAVSIEEAQAKLLELIDGLEPGAEVLITKDNQAVARLTAERGEHPRRPRLGTAQGELVILQEDDEHLEDFREYM